MFGHSRHCKDVLIRVYVQPKCHDLIPIGNLLLSDCDSLTASQS